MFDKKNTKYLEWIENENLIPELREHLLNANDDELNAAFSISLEFGTAGIRGVLGAGPGRFNIYTIKQVTRAYVELLKQKHPKDLATRGIVVGHDNRYKSIEFANAVAEILTSLGVKAYLFKNNDMKPTPVVSYAVKDLNTIGGIVVTASHNPAIYNGYKIYDEFGCQLIDSDTVVISKEMEIDSENMIDWNYVPNKKLLLEVSNSTIENYNTMIKKLQFHEKADKNKFEIIYSAVNGTGTEFVPPILEESGYKVIQVEEHAFEDPSFKNVINPNPEFPPAWEIPLKKYGKANPNANIIVMTDPDADRIGLAVNHNNEWIRLDGNQTGPLLIDWKLSQLKAINKIPKNPALYSSFVTSDLGDRIAAETYGVKVVKTLTGFKWMGSEILKEKDNGLNFVFAYEESYGYVLDSSTLDKDGIQAAIMLSEMAWFYKTKHNKSLIDVLHDLYAKYGFYTTYTENLNFKPEEIKSKIDPILSKFRNNPPKEFAGLKMIKQEDYINGLHNMPGQNLLKFYYEDGSWFAVRPSGTEPKVKIYFIAVAKDEKESKTKLDKMLVELKNFIK
ncbi:phospho-sugar mutase [Spiroplasma endosymbiont of Othius punctulatus]|uniref:phospho-sugar mutase n=1 Tax=Spiroplasma endosymbiont of Othius punctulatus TaxID=3066289 RepID=UPI0030D380F3